MTRDKKPLFGPLAAAIFGAAVAALGGSLWAAWTGVGCTACGDGRALVAGWPLAWIGVGFYAVLSLVAGLGKRPALTQTASCAAAGVHLVLLSLLLWHRLFCLPCTFTALAAFACAALTLAAGRPGAFTLASFLIAALVSAWALTTSHLPAPEPLPRVQPGHVRLLVYERTDCYECAMFEAQMVNRLYDELGDALTIVRIPAPAGMQTPTIVVEGRNKTMLTGLPAFHDLEQVIKEALVQPD